MKNLTKIILATALISTATTSFASSLNNQYGRQIELDSEATKVDYTNFASFNYSAANLTDLAELKPGFIEGVGHMSFYGNRLQHVNEMFDIKYIDGNFTLHDNPLVHINGLQNLEKIRGHFYLHNNNLTSLDGLLNLKEVGSDFMITPTAFDNKNRVVDIRGLQSLEKVGNGFHLKDVQVKNLNPLSRLTRVGGHFSLENTGIRDLNGLTNLRYANTIDLSDNPHLIDIGGIHSLNTEKIWIDKDITTRASFRGLRNTAVLCQPDKADRFFHDGAQQEDVCGF